MNTLVKKYRLIAFQLSLVVIAIVNLNEASAQCNIAAPDTVVKCLGQTHNLATGVSVSGTTGAVTYSWDGGAFAASPNKTVSPTVTTTYVLTIMDGAGCTDTEDVVIRIIPIPTVSAGADVQACAGNTTQLCATATSANGAVSIYNWLGGLGIGQCKNVSPSVQTTYTVYVQDVAGCAATDNVTVFVNPLPTVSAGNDQSMCLSQGSQQMSGTPAGGTWTGPNVSASGLFTPTATGDVNLTYTYTNSNNCPNSDVMVMSVTTPSPINGGNDLELCLNTTAVQLPNVGVWSGSSSVSSSGLFTPNSVGPHSLTVTNGAPGCQVFDYVSIIVLPLPVLNAGVDVSICNGQCAQLNATASSSNGSISNIVWTGSPISNASILNPNVCPTSNTSYTIQVTDNKNCQATDAVNITVNNLPVVNAGNDIIVCTNASPVTLTGQTPAGGVWSGTGVTAAGVFTPGAPGNVNLTYTFTTGANCSVSDTRTVQVIAPSAVNTGPDIEVCLNAIPVQLMGGGTWTGSSWVSASGLFTPGAVGDFTLTYSTVIGQCTSTDQLIVHVLSLPVVNAGADQSVCAGDLVQMNGSGSSSNGAINSYQWNQGFVSDQSIANPTFTAVSNSTLTLTATDIKNCSASDQVSVTVNNPPAVNAGNNVSACLNQTSITLSGATPAGGTWSGAGISASGVYTISTAGPHTVTYTYFNAAGCDASDDVVIDVIAPSAVNAGLDIDICLNSTAVQLDGAGTWSGSSWVNSSGLFTPGAVGDFTLTYSVTSGVCTSTDQMVVHVLPLPSTNAGPDQTVCVGNLVQLNGSGSSTNGAIQSYQWNQVFVSDQNISNPTFTASSTVSLNLTVTDIKNCSSSDNISITVNSPTPANAGNDVTACSNQNSVTLTGATPAGGTWSGSGISSSGVYTIGSTGQHQVTYTYTNAGGCISSDDLIIEIISPTGLNAGPDVEVCLGEPAFPLGGTGTWSGSSWVTAAGLFTPGAVGDFTLTYTLTTGACTATDNIIVHVYGLPTANAGADISICEGDSYQLTGSASGGDSNYDYLWDNAPLLNHPDYANPTINTSASTLLTFTVTDGNNCSSDDQVMVTVVPMPVASFNADAVVCSNTAVQFSNTSTDANSYAWSFGNASNSTATNPTSTYLLDGIFNVVLTAYNSLLCSTTSSQSIEVVSAPVASFNASVISGCSPLNVTFSNTSTGYDVNYNWDFDGTVSSLQDPLPVDFTATGATESYNVTMTASNFCGTSTDTETISVNPQPVAFFNTTSSTVCSPVITHFNNISTGNSTSFHWEFGDGDDSDSVNPAPKVYTTDDEPEQYVIKLYAYNACGTDLYEEVLTVQPNTIETSVSPSVVQGCSPLFVQFSNSTIGATVHHYDFDDSETSSLQAPAYVFQNPGTYDVVYIANDGCSFDTVNMSINVLPSPTIVISADQIAVCPFEQVGFDAQTTGDIASIYWNYGDGNDAFGANVQHSFQSGNTYFIGATANAQNGCDANASMQFTVHPKPAALVNLSTDGGCSPLNICTENNSTDATVYAWDFGNGNTSADFEPCNLYTNISGAIVDHSISLHAENVFGCTDDTTLVIQVQPQPTAQFNLSSAESCFENEVITVNMNTTGADAYDWYSDNALVSSDLSPTFQFAGVGEHSIELKAFNNFGCVDSLSATYTIHPTPSIEIMPNPFNGCAPLQVIFENETSNASEYQWIFGNGQTSSDANARVVFDEPGFYDVQLTAVSIHGCESIQAFEDMIEVFELPVALFNVDSEDGILYETTVPFDNMSEGGVDYNWNFGNGYGSSEFEPEYDFRKGGDYEVSLLVTNEYGCDSTFTKSIKIDNTVYVIVPNAFTPGTDGINDRFMPSISSVDEIFSYAFRIFNKWGEVVFETNNPEDGWIGDVRSGEYFVHNDYFNWEIIISYDNGQPAKKYQGEVMVLR